MGSVYISSDLHFGHKNIFKMRDDFASEKEHTDTIIQNWNNILTKNDTAIILGDVAFNKEGLERTKELNGNKILVLGNHDNLKVDYLNYFYKVYGVKEYKGYWLTHVPVHPEHIRGKHKINLHGHLHSETIADKNYINVCLEQSNYYPIPFDSIQNQQKID